MSECISEPHIQTGHFHNMVLNKTSCPLLTAVQAAISGLLLTSLLILKYWLWKLCPPEKVLRRSFSQTFKTPLVHGRIRPQKTIPQNKHHPVHPLLALWPVQHVLSARLPWSVKPAPAYEGGLHYMVRDTISFCLSSWKRLFVMSRGKKRRRKKANPPFWH